MTPVFVMLIVANIFMTYAWYGHLKDQANQGLITVILISWGVAFLEYCFQVPANRMGAKLFTIPQLKIIQEFITLTVFAVFSILYLKVPITKNYAYASLCMLAAVYFIFRDKSPTSIP